MDAEQQQREAVLTAYSERAKKRDRWFNKYDLGLQISKMLCDYNLLGRIDLLDKTVLNIGCSEPVDEAYWVDLVREWHALDINEDAVEVAKAMVDAALSPELRSRLKFFVGDITELAIDDDSYDVVVAFSTIDHIPGRENREKAIGEMSRVVKKGGYLVVTVPNKWDLIYSYRSNKKQREGSSIYGYEHQFSPLELTRMIRANGLRVIGYASTAFNPYSNTDMLMAKLKLHWLKIPFGTRFGCLAQK